MNLKTGKGLKISYPKRPGLWTVDGCAFLYHFCTCVMDRKQKLFPRLRTLFNRYHNGVSIFEILFKLSKPHGMTYVGDQKYLVSLWASSTHFIIDLKAQTMEVQSLFKMDTPHDVSGKIRRALAAKEQQEVFSTYQYYDADNEETYFASQLRDRGKVSAYHKKGVNYDVPTRVRKHNWKTRTTADVWEGTFGEAVHYTALSQDKRYLGLVQFGDFHDLAGRLLPSRILILDLVNKKEWPIDNTGWSPSAHIDWDPVEPNVCYLSCHNGVIVPVDSPIRFLLQKVYKWDVFGPASIHKYAMSESGPRKVGVFTDPCMFRMTIHKAFVHRQRTILACTGFPNLVFLADADSLKLIGKVEVREESGEESVVGSLYPSPDGEKLFLATNGSLQIVDVAAGRVESACQLGRIHDPFNHMTSVADTDW